MEKAEKIKGKVKSAMTYPVIIAGIAVLIVGALMVVVIPQCSEGIFQGHAERPADALPLLTLVCHGLQRLGEEPHPDHDRHHRGDDPDVYRIQRVAFKKTKFGTSAVDWFLSQDSCRRPAVPEVRRSAASRAR